jgi:hypothetical protein
MLGKHSQTEVPEQFVGQITEESLMIIRLTVVVYMIEQPVLDHCKQVTNSCILVEDYSAKAQ